MIKVTSPGAAQEVWVNPEHITKVWQRQDGLTMLRFVNGETLQIRENLFDFIVRLNPDAIPDPTWAVTNAIKEQTKQLHHLNLLMEALVKAKSNNFSYNVPSVPYLSY